MDDEYGGDDDLFEAMAAAEAASTARQPVQQPKPQRLDKAPPSLASRSSEKGVVQPTPQAAPKKTSGSTILVSPRQRGNPVLTSLRSIPWEYSDIPADYVLGQTTCALFLSLKYHRLHPEYIYKRIQNLQGRYNLRVLLTLVDIPNHEDPLRELSKTSMINNVTIMLCWSAAEAARYLELYKSYESASFTAIKGQQSSNYADRLVDFVTVPRSLNKMDAVALVANFGSLRNAINAEPEQLALLGGWGEVKVKRWMAAKEEPFRAKKASKRGNQQSLTDARHDAVVRDGYEQGGGSAPLAMDFDEGDEEALLNAALEESEKMLGTERDRQRKEELVAEKDDELSGGVAKALAKLRENG
ncbi:Mating-type switching protein swi10 [Escovopsis weberi]|uniref:Mating-type switching protein swi10 n=1 Tax=Escovopsis weberi TaxID=150374 RepID=A0A0M8N9C2_ESCWE|nr:Mating-type switching protein swi10 [Escovopsis weberi]